LIIAFLRSWQQTGWLSYNIVDALKKLLLLLCISIIHIGMLLIISNWTNLFAFLIIFWSCRFEGLRGFYKGITPSILKHVPISSISIVIYENVLKLLKLASRNDWVFSFYFMMFHSFSRFWCYKICDPTLWMQFLNMTAFLPHVPSFSCPRLDTVKFGERNFCTFFKSDIFLTFVL